MVCAQQLYTENRAGLTYAQLADTYGLTVGQVSGKIYRYKQANDFQVAQFAERYRKKRGITSSADLFNVDLGRPWMFDEPNALIVGDVQIPTSDYDWLALVLAIGEEYLKPPRRLIIAGDLINADAFKTYENDEPEPSWEHEIQAGEAFLSEVLEIYDDVRWFLGNHERRVGKRTKTSITPIMLLRLMTRDPRVSISSWGHCVVRNPFGWDWRVTHARNYSINQLTVADQLAQRYQQNIIQHHEHHLAKGMDRYKRYVIINNGGLFDQQKMAYVMKDDSKSADMMNGFTLLRDGHADLFGPEGYTRWKMWLSET